MGYIGRHRRGAKRAPQPRPEPTADRVEERAVGLIAAADYFDVHVVDELFGDLL
jgi:hypothetical protein